MKKHFLIYLIAFVPFFASAQLTPVKTIVSRVTDSTATVPSGWGAIRFNAQRTVPAWQFYNGSSWQLLGSGGSGGSSYTFTNLLTNSSGTVKLGGTATENTSLDLDGYELEITNGNALYIGTGLLPMNGYFIYATTAEYNTGILNYFSDEVNFSGDIVNFDVPIHVKPIGASSGDGGRIFFREVGFGTNTIGFKAPDAISSNVLWTLPSADGSSGQVLSTNGSGVLSWASGGGGGSGTVNSGTQYRLGYYAATGTAISEAAAITANRALISDANGVPTHSSVTNTELGYSSGVTSAIQTQLNDKWSLSSNGTFTSPLTFSGSTTNTLSFDFTSLGTTTTNRVFNLINTTAAAAGSQQISPVLWLRGNGWKTNATAASQSVEYGTYVLPVQGASAPTGEYRNLVSINGAAPTPVGWNYYSSGAVGLGMSASFGASQFFSTSSPTASSQTLGAAGTFFGYTTNSGTESSIVILGLSGTSNLTATGASAPAGLLNLNGGVSVSSGTANFKILRTTNTINQSGSASGIVYAISPELTITNAKDLVGYDWNPTNPTNVSGSHYSFRGVSGQAIFGKTARTNTDSRVEINGTGTGSDKPLAVYNSSGTERLSIQSNGALLVNNDAGTSGYTLTSAGSSSPPVWSAPVVKAESTGVSFETLVNNYGELTSGSTNNLSIRTNGFYSNKTTLFVEVVIVGIKNDGTASVSATVSGRFRKDNSGTFTIDDAGTSVISDLGVIDSVTLNVNGTNPNVEIVMDAASGTWEVSRSVKITSVVN